MRVAKTVRRSPQRALRTSGSSLDNPEVLQEPPGKEEEEYECTACKQERIN